MNCKSLSSIKFENLIEYEFSDQAFSQCESLKELSIISYQKGIIKQHCFSDCKNLSSISLASKNIIIGSFCFSHSLKLSFIEIRAEKLIIYERSFYKCESLESLIFDKVKNVVFNPGSFTKCFWIKNISLIHAQSLTFGDACFINNKNIASIEIESDKINFCNNFIRNFPCLKEIILKSSQDIIIAQNMFSECKSLKNVEIISEKSINLTERCFFNLINH